MSTRYLLMTVLLLIGINSFPQTITIQSKTDVPEGAVSAALTMTGFGNQVSAFQWTITYDPAVLTFTGATDWFSGVGGVGVYTPESGKITFVWGDNPVAIEGVLCKLNFTTTGQGCSDLTWADNPTPRLVADGTASYNEYSVSYVNGQICSSTPVVYSPACTIQSMTDVPEGAVSAELSMTGFGNQVSAFQWTISYDPAVLTFTGATDWFSGVADVGVYTPELGKITFVWGDIPVAIEGVLCKLNFTTTGQGCSDLTWSDNPTPRLVADGTNNYNEYTVSYVNGQICSTPVAYSPVCTIQSKTDVPEGAVSAELSMTGFGNQVSAFQWTITYDPAVLTFTGATDWFSGVADVGVYTPELGKITFVWGDIPVAIEGVLCKLNFTTTGQGCSDLTWADNPTPRLVADGTNNYNEYTVSYVNGQICSTPVVYSPVCTIQSKTDVPEGAVSAALTMTGFGNQVSAFQWTISYDPAVLTFTGATDWFSGVGGVGVYTPELGKITFVWGDIPVAIEGVLCKLNFTTTGQGCSDLTWSDNPTPRLVADGTVNYNEYSVSYVNGQICKTVTSSDDYMLNRSSFMIYPTFAKEKITITYTFPEDGKIIVLFYDLNGDEIIKTDHIIVANYTTKQEISTAALSPGIYFIKYLIKSGSINLVKVEKIFVSR